MYLTRCSAFDWASSIGELKLFELISFVNIILSVLILFRIWLFAWIGVAISAGIVPLTKEDRSDFPSLN